MRAADCDKAIKEALSDWTMFTKKYWSTPEGSTGWIQCQPKTGDTTTPLITLAGAEKGKTQPDGMYTAFVHGRCVDLICVEACTSKQNFGDKRSRYVPSISSQVLRVHDSWLDEAIAYKGGRKPRRELINEKGKGVLLYPVRHLRVLFALTDELYKEHFIDHVIPHAHEYVCKISSLKSITNQQFLAFIKGMSPASHFYTKS
jgi:hypothetical protein